MDFIDRLERLQKLHEARELSDDEYAAAKARLLRDRSEEDIAEGPASAMPKSPEALEQETRRWAMYLHLSQLASFVIPAAGIVAPILIWQLKKAELPGIDVHGKNVANWIMSAAIYALASILLAFFLIGIPLLVAVVVVSVVFPTLGAIKANNGEVWKYPLTITIIK